jgi:hypothetical protein
LRLGPRRRLVRWRLIRRRQQRCAEACAVLC